LRDALQRLLDSIDIPRSVRVEVQGSIARGDADRYSDADLRFTGEPESVAHLREAFPGVLATLGTVLSAFPATHLGLDDLLVTFVEVDGRVVKIDADFSAGESSHSDEISSARLQDGDRKFVGWMWYTFAKIGRGEYFESAAALDTMRGSALVPLLLHMMQLPPEGYRRLELRLSAAVQGELRATYPRTLEQDELLRAFLAMTDFYRRLRKHDLSEARFDRMLAIIRREAKALGGGEFPAR